MNRIKIPFSEFTFFYARSGGAGGQNVNKVNTKVTLNWKIEESPSVSEDLKLRFKERYGNLINQEGQVQITGQRHRTQKANLDDCIAKLHEMLHQVATPPKVRRPTKPKKSAVLKRLQSKKKDSEKKRLRKKEF